MSACTSRLDAMRGRLWFGVLFTLLAAVVLLPAGCASVNMHCDGAGKGWECNPVDGPPERHTRTPYQPPWSDEHHDIGVDRPRVSQRVYEFMNEERAALYRHGLREDTTLSRIACWHNKDMLGHNYLEHEDSDGRMHVDRVAREHRRLIGSVGENAVKVYRIPKEEATPEANRAWARHIMDRWMGSPGHKENLLKQKWTHVGTCVTNDSVQARGTQVFANVRGYFDEPIPWTVAPDDSLPVSVTPYGDHPRPVRYQFVPAGESLDEAFVNDRPEHSFDGTLAVPSSTGTYGLRLLMPSGNRTYTILPGPRVRVLGEGEVPY